MEKDLYDKATEEYNNKQYGSAIKTLSKLSGTASRYYFLRSQIFYDQCELAKALTEAKQCLELEKNNFHMMALICKIYAAMMNVEDAEKMFAELESTNPKYENLEEIRKLIEEKKDIVQREKEKYPTVYQDYLDYLKILYSKGALIKNIELKFHTLSYRSAVTTNLIKKNEVFLRMPPELIISLELARECPLGKKISGEIEKKLNSPHHTILATYLLSELEKGPSSKWAYYFKLLPTDLSNFPIFYNESELELLKGTLFLKTLEERKKDIEDDYKLLCARIPEYKRFSFENFQFYRMIVGSRIFGVTIKGNNTDIIVPYADMLNHKEPRETHWTYNNKEDAFMVNAEMDLPEGREVFYSYGRKCNSRFLLNYGFTIENNEENEFKVTVKVGKDFKMYSAMKYKKFSLKKTLKDMQFKTFISFLRALMEDAEYDDICKERISQKSLPVSKDNEFAVLNKIKDLFAPYAGLTDSIEEDYEKLKDTNLSFNERNCIIMRLSEKEVVKFYTGLYEAGIKFLAMDKNEYETTINDERNEYVKNYGEYLRDYKTLFE